MRRRNFGPRPVINSIKNSVVSSGGLTGTNTVLLIAKAVNTPASTVKSDVSQGCLVKALWISLDVCGLGGTGVLNSFTAYLFKNPGDNLTGPGVFSIGTSNEKKFVFKEWTAMIMRNQDGNNPYHWEGWVKVPRRYHRMGTDDTLTMIIACTAALTGHFLLKTIYKWYR